MSTIGSTTPQENVLLAAIMCSGKLPNIDPRVEDLTPTATRIWRAACALAADNQEINAVNVWRRDNQLDPLLLCEIVSALPNDLPARHLDLMVFALEGEVRRRREAA